MMVVLFHFTVAGSDVTGPFLIGLPNFAVSILKGGQFGVEIFFVISGFVIAYSQRGTKVTPRYFLNFALRRSFRLDPPYWFAIFLEIVILGISARLVHDRPHSLPSVKQVLAHLGYLQEILHYSEILPVFWTLCLEVQFYILFTLVRGLASWNAPPQGRDGVEGAILTLLAAASLCVYCRWIPEPFSGTFLPYWFFFFLGVTVWWAISSSKNTGYFWAMTSVAALAGIVRVDLAISVGVATAAAIFAAAKLNKMGTWLSGPVIQFLGRISYSLYLIHVAIGTRVIILGGRYTGDSVGPRLLVRGLGLFASIAAATAMYLLIERPSMRLSHRFLKGDRRRIGSARV